MRKQGWINEAGEVVWPQNLRDREKMARGLFGFGLVSDLDYWILLAEDELYDTSEAPWASSKRQQPEEADRRAIFRTLNAEQREAVRELLHRVMTGNLHSLCVALDQGPLGGATIRLEQPNDGHNEALEICSPRQPELAYEQYQWREDFSMIFGEDERDSTEA